MSGFRNIARMAVVVLAAGCTGDGRTPTAPAAGPTQTISDAAHGGQVPGFYFLQPLVKSPNATGTFDAALEPRVEICQLAGTACGAGVAQFTLTSGTGGELLTVDAVAGKYQVNWHTDKFGLDPAKHYRVSVFVGTYRLGFADVDVVSSGKELKRVDTQEYIALQDGRTLPIKFRIETGIPASLVVTPAAATVEPAGTQQFTATVTDLHGNVLPVPVSWASLAPAVATVDANGRATGVAPGSAGITASFVTLADTATLTVAVSNTAPTATGDQYEALGNVTVSIPAPGVLANDADAEGNALAAVPGTVATANGGSVVVNADGSIVYRAAAGFVGEDSFEYVATDGSLTSAPATVKVTSSARVWFVNNTADAPGDGRDGSPFTTLKGAETASSAGEAIYVFAGNGATAGYDEGIVLRAGQALNGQGVTADYTATLNGQVVTLLPAGAAPQLTRNGAGATVAISTGNTLKGMDVASTAGAGIQGSGFGTLNVEAVSVAAVGGPALDLENGNASATFTALSSTGSTGNGVRLAGVTGLVHAAGGAIVASAANGVRVQGGTADVELGGSISVTTGASVRITGRTGGTVTLSGPIADMGAGIVVESNTGGIVELTGVSKAVNTGASSAVTLANNTGSSVRFAGGGLALTTTTGDAFSATGGGTVEVTGAGNTITAAGGRALHVTGTIIGGLGLTFRSITSTGGAEGIVMENTGALNGLLVTGEGTTAGSGGTLSGGAYGVRLDGVRNVLLRNMQVSGFTSYAIRGSNVNGFELRGSTVSGANGTAAGEGSVRFDALTGSALVTGSAISGGFTDNLRVTNSAGSLDRLVIEGSTFGAHQGSGGDDGVELEAVGAAVMNVTIHNSTFTSAASDLLSVALSGGAVSDLVVEGNTFANANAAVAAGGGGITIAAVGTSSPTLTYRVSGNTLRNALGPALAVVKGPGAGSFSGTIEANVVGVSGAANSGSAQGSGIDVSSIGGGSHVALVRNNQVRQYNNHGILLQAGNNAAGGSGSLHATVTGNRVEQPGTAGFLSNGVHVNAGTNTADAHQVCADVRGNALAGSSAAGATEFRLRQRFLTTVRIPGYVGANNDNAAVAAFVQANNGGATGAAANTVSTGGGGFVGGAGCTQP
ncbi:MAG TPA: Ig-like domain-containing protein [Longimicrobium sp.]